MPGGRPPLGTEVIDGFDASDDAKLRVKTVLDFIAGRLNIAQATAALGVNKARLYAMRDEILEGALAAAERKTPGRKPESPDVAAARAREEAALARVEKLEYDLEMADLRTEIALTMPELMIDPDDAEALKKTAPTRAAPRKRKKPF